MFGGDWMSAMATNIMEGILADSQRERIFFQFRRKTKVTNNILILILDQEEWPSEHV